MNYLGFDKERVASTAQNLNALLAEYHIYYQNLRNFHWNISGDNFFVLHKQFEGLYNDAREVIDDIAERILTLRYRPVSKMSDYIDMAQIEEASVVEVDRDMVMTILENHKVIIAQLREAIATASDAGDEGTVDMLSSFLENIEKKSWMLDAWAAEKLEPVIA